jgi:hypothetical protein
MKWTEELPTQAGYYWHSFSGEGTSTPRICEIFRLEEGGPLQIQFAGWYRPVTLKDYGGFWMGPLEVPEVPND